MKKVVKKLTAVLLVLSVLMSLAIPAAAVEKLAPGVPMIHIGGIASRNLYADMNTDAERQVFWPTTDSITGAVKKLIFPIARLAFDKNWDAFNNKLIPAANEMFEMITCNPDGTSKYDVTIKNDWYGIPPGYNFDRTLSFYYDWRLDPMDIAVDLHNYIQYIKRETGCQKVALLPESMGGVTVTAYLSLYGTTDVAAVIMRSSAFQGVSLVGELFNRNISIDKVAVLGYVGRFLEPMENGGQIALLLKVLDMFGMLDVILSAVSVTLDNLKERAYDESLIPVFGYMPGVWSLVPDEYYESAKRSMLDETVNAALIEKIDNYHYNAQAKAETLLKQAMADGVRVAVIANYNLFGVPISPQVYAQTDYLIDTVYASGGATCAPLNASLGEGYVQAVQCGHNHVSPDLIVDASTCMFPEHTWFVKNMIHTEFRADYRAMVSWILEAPAQPTVFTDARYPQFQQFNIADETLSPVTAAR